MLPCTRYHPSPLVQKYIKTMIHVAICCFFLNCVELPSHLVLVIFESSYTSCWLKFLVKSSYNLRKLQLITAPPITPIHPTTALHLRTTSSTFHPTCLQHLLHLPRNTEALVPVSQLCLVLFTDSPSYSPGYNPRPRPPARPLHLPNNPHFLCDGARL